MSPRSRGRPPGRRQRRQLGRRPGPQGKRPVRLTPVEAGEALLDEITDCWFDEPLAGDRRSWAVPTPHGTYRGLELQLLNPDDESELSLLLEAFHPGLEDETLEAGEEMTGEDGEPFNRRLHVTMHAIVARQLLSDDPPETWHTVQRLARMGYGWHDIMHMIAGLVAEDVHRAINEKRRFDAADYVRRLNALPGDWPAPKATGG